MESQEEITYDDPSVSAHWGLYLKGKEVWNGWALGKLTDNEYDCLSAEIGPLPDPEEPIEFINIEFAEKISFNGFIFNGDAQFINVIFKEKVTFDCVNFNKKVNFVDSKFEDESSFIWTFFFGPALFSGAFFGLNDTCYGKAIFSGAKFYAICDFIDTVFKNGCDFTEVTFYAWAHFRNARFEGWAEFENATFYDTIDFSGAKFFDWASFEKASFDNHVMFHNVEFKHTVDFQSSSFAYPPELHNSSLHQDIILDSVVFEGKDGELPLIERAWRTLRIAMSEQHNHQMEHLFFQFEMDVKLKQFGFKNSFSYFQLAIYKYASNYGWSFLRPIALLICSVAIFAFVYLNFSESVPSISEGLSISVSNTIPFSPIKAKIFKELENPSVYFVIVSIIQSILSVLLLFLVGLGLRNQFRIK